MAQSYRGVGRAARWLIRQDSNLRCGVQSALPYRLATDHYRASGAAICKLGPAAPYASAATTVSRLGRVAPLGSVGGFAPRAGAPPFPSTGYLIRPPRLPQRAISKLAGMARLAGEAVRAAIPGQLGIQCGMDLAPRGLKPNAQCRADLNLVGRGLNRYRFPDTSPFPACERRGAVGAGSLPAGKASLDGWPTRLSFDRFRLVAAPTHCPLVGSGSISILAG